MKSFGFALIISILLVIALLVAFGYFCQAVGAADFGADSQPTIEGKTEWKPYQLVRLRAAKVDPTAGILWRVYPAKDVDRATTGRGLLEFSAPPGDYRVELLVISKGALGEIEVTEAFESIRIGEPPPPPPPPKPPTPKTQPREALGRIRFGNSGCTATIIGPRRADGRWNILTAAHCLSGVDAVGTFTMQDGRSFRVRCVAHDRTPDLAWLVTDESPAELPYARLAESVPPPGTKIWHSGFGIDKPGNLERGEVSGGVNSQGLLSMRLSVSSGDSGGGIFREDTGELVSVVCCTQSRGVFTTMFGGTSVIAAKMKPTAVDSSDVWEPVPIPIIKPKTTLIPILVPCLFTN